VLRNLILPLNLGKIWGLALNFAFLDEKFPTRKFFDFPTGRNLGGKIIIVPDLSLIVLRDDDDKNSQQVICSVATST